MLRRGLRAMGMGLGLTGVVLVVVWYGVLSSEGTRDLGREV